MSRDEGKGITKVRQACVKLPIIRRGLRGHSGWKAANKGSSDTDPRLRSAASDQVSDQVFLDGEGRAPANTSGHDSCSYGGLSLAVVTLPDVRRGSVESCGINV